MSARSYDERAVSVDSLVCVGLDSAIERLPARFLNDPHPQFAFNRWIIDQTHEYVSAYKPNTAFYEARGAAGWDDLARTMDYLRAQHPDIFTICDAKRADIETTNAGYVRAIFDDLGFDAVTLHPYLGSSAMQPFLSRIDKTSIVLCRTSNHGAGELQDIRVGDKPLWQIVAETVRDIWNTHDQCMLVVGATYPDDLRRTRAIVGAMTLLVPGIGAQGGSAAAVMTAANADGRGLIVNASRSVIFSDDPAREARALRDILRAS